MREVRPGVFVFAVDPGCANWAVKELGFEEGSSYDTVRCGTVVNVVAPDGTEELGMETPGCDVAPAYRSSARYKFRLPDGRVFVGGGAGPSDLDSIVLR